MRKLLQELYECERMMKLAEGAGVPLHRAHVNPDAQIKPPVTEPSKPETKTETAQPAFNPPASAASHPNSTLVPAAPTSRYPNGFVAATHAAEAGNTVTMEQRPDGTGAPEGLDPTPSPLKPVTVSEDKPAGEPSETPAASQEPTTPAASQEPTTPADPEEARRAAYIEEHGKRPEWTKETPAESIWSDPTFQSNTLTGLGVGLLGGLGGYALTGGRGGLAPWLMLGGGISAGISGLSGYNQWNANKTEYEDFRKKQKEWDEGLAALTAETEDKMLEDSAYQSAFPEDLPENYSVNRRELENKGIVAPQRTRFDQTVTPAYKEVAQYIPYADHTLKVGSNGAQYRGYQQRLGRNMHLYWLPDEAMTTGGHELQAVARFWSRKGHLSNQLTSDPEAYTWWLDGKKISPALARAYIDNANKYATKPGLLLSEDNPTAYKHLAQMRDWLNADWWTGNAFRWGVNDYTGTAPMFGVF